ncbi:MAG: NUDIX domain-containing protein [Lachnospiraceae bacterium]|nr:NUDIX domain-containing protein [Lachnospiraceae bacterium]
MLYDGKLRNMTAIYLMQGDKMLLLYRQGSKVVSNMWIGAAGGHFEENELNNPKACVLRELKEELGITEDMLRDLKLRYIVLRGAKDEIRQNYYFFAELSKEYEGELSSNEGELKWFCFEEIPELKMPLSTQCALEHYLRVGRYDDKVYAGIADGEKVVFTEVVEF